MSTRCGVLERELQEERLRREAAEKKLEQAEKVFVVMRGTIPMENAGLLRVWDYEDGAKADSGPDSRGGTVSVRAGRLLLEDP